MAPPAPKKHKSLSNCEIVCDVLLSEAIAYNKAIMDYNLAVMKHNQVVLSVVGREGREMHVNLEETLSLQKLF